MQEDYRKCVIGGALRAPCMEEECNVPVEEKQIEAFIQELRFVRVEYENVTSRLGELFDRIKPPTTVNGAVSDQKEPSPYGYLEEMNRERFILGENLENLRGLVANLERIF